MMRKRSIVTPVFAAIVGTVLILPAEASAAEWQPVKDKDVAPSSLGPACNYHSGFSDTDVITVTVVTNRRLEIKAKSPGGATKTTTSTGELVLTFAHLDANGALIKAVTVDVGGPTTVTSYHDGTGLFDGSGKNWLSFGPKGRVNTGEPGLVFTDGHVVVHSVGIVATMFSLDPGGSEVDGCALLSG